MGIQNGRVSVKSIGRNISKQPQGVKVSKRPGFAPTLARNWVHWHCRGLVIAPHIPTAVVFFDELLGDSEEQFTKLLHFAGAAFAAQNLSRALAGKARPD